MTFFSGAVKKKDWEKGEKILSIKVGLCRWTFKREPYDRIQSDSFDIFSPFPGFFVITNCSQVSLFLCAEMKRAWARAQRSWP